MSTPNGAYTRTNSFGPGDSRDVVRFFLDPVLDARASEAAGRQIFTDVERIEIRFPGNMTTIYHGNVTDEFRQKYAAQYEAFKAGHEVAHEGTPIEEWPILTRAHVRELKYMGVHTVEQAANMTDLACQNIGMGGMGLRMKARAYLDDGERNAVVEQVTAENDRMRSEIASLRAQVEQLGTLVQTTHSQMMEAKNAPPAVHTFIPGAADPVELAKLAPMEGGGGSALDSFGTPPKRGPGRPRKSEAA